MAEPSKNYYQQVKIEFCDGGKQPVGHASQWHVYQQGRSDHGHLSRKKEKYEQFLLGEV